MLIEMLATAAFAGQDAVSLKTVGIGQVSDPPRFELKVNQRAASLDVHIDCGGPKAAFQGPASMGQHIVLPLEGAVGTYDCRGHLEGEFADGTTGSMPLSFGIEIREPMKLVVPKASVDLDGKRFQLTIDRPVSTVEVTLYGKGGSTLGKGTGIDPSSVQPGRPIDVQWRQDLAGEVVKIVVRATDPHGFWVELELFPWSYAIPHEDVVFETGSWEIWLGEEPKLTDALARVQEVQQEYQGQVPVNLFIAGYTDTVGDPASNLTLSRNRAQAIAEWFRAAGFTGELYYQGFGEQGLMVQTPDGTDEERNRRATYLAAAEAPAKSEQLPGSDWRPVR